MLARPVECWVLLSAQHLPQKDRDAWMLISYTFSPTRLSEGREQAGQAAPHALPTSPPAESPRVLSAARRTRRRSLHSAPHGTR